MPASGRLKVGHKWNVPSRSREASTRTILDSALHSDSVASACRRPTRPMVSAVDGESVDSRGNSPKKLVEILKALYVANQNEPAAAKRQGQTVSFVTRSMPGTYVY